MVRIYLVQGFRLFYSLIDIVSNFKVGHNMAIFNKVDNIEIEPALAPTVPSIGRGLLHPQTSQTSQMSQFRVKRHTTTNVAIYGGQMSHRPLTSQQTLRTTNVTKRRNMFCAHFQLLKCYSFISILVYVLSLK